MKFKLDENFGSRTLDIFRKSGHDVCTVRDQKLEGSPDQELYKVCSSESTCLITLDKDFSDVTRFPPENSNGIVVIRLPRNPSHSLLESLIVQFIHSLEKIKVEGNLLIVETGRIRIHQSDEERE